MGFCYGGPYAILGPKRLGYDAGLSCHGTQMLDYHRRLDGVTRRSASCGAIRTTSRRPTVLDAYRAVPARQNNVEVHIFPGILHGYMMPDRTKAYDANTRAFSMERALSILDGLRTAGARRIEAAE